MATLNGLLLQQLVENLTAEKARELLAHWKLSMHMQLGCQSAPLASATEDGTTNSPGTEAALLQTGS
jgi:hypothetical protein